MVGFDQFNRAFARRENFMSKHVLAIEPQFVLEPPEREESLKAEAEELWSQEAIVHARAENRIMPEQSREQLQRLINGVDIKRLML